MLTATRNFISYWYFRYLLVTELYMVEKWERAMFHIIIFILIAIAYIFNTTVMLGLVRMANNYFLTSANPKGSEYIDTVNTDTNNYDL